jgi:hypothetical protein
MSCNTVTFKRGTSFGESVVWNPDAGGLANLIGVTVTSTIIDSDRNEFELVVTVAGNGLSITATYNGSTADWGVGTARWDIKFSNAGSIFYSETMRLDVIGQVTA